MNVEARRSVKTAGRYKVKEPTRTVAAPQALSPGSAPTLSRVVEHKLQSQKETLLLSSAALAGAVCS
jgi:hypothetical protein